MRNPVEAYFTPALVSQQKPRRDWSRPQVIIDVGCLDLMDRGASVFPLWLSQADSKGFPGLEPTDNLSRVARDYSSRLGLRPEDVLCHVVAITHSPAYATENQGGLISDWPRIPFSSAADAMSKSVELGRRIIGLLDVHTKCEDVPRFGVPKGVSKTDIGPDDLGVTARWGIVGKGGVTMPSVGRMQERPFDSDELERIARLADQLGLSTSQAVSLLGTACLDVFLNDAVYWAGVPKAVWEYDIGGYQVIKKWLSYREETVLGRRLSSEEARYVAEMVGRITMLVLLEPRLDENYRRIQADTWEWPGA